MTETTLSGAGRAPLRRTSTALADGRELLYYDAPGGCSRSSVDTRPLGPRQVLSELRYDPVLEVWVVYASQRQDRTYLPATEECPLCPSRPGHPTEVPEPDYEVVVFENRFPAFGALRAEELAGAGPLEPGALLARQPAPGRCEVVCYTSDHDAGFADLSAARVDLVISTLTDRTAELSALPGVRQVFCFENRGREIGVTLSHPHGQIYAYPYVTPRTARMLHAATAWRRAHGRNLFEELLEAELAARSRIVTRGEHWTAFVPHAARFPYELHCYPNRRVPDLASLGEDARSELPGVLLDCFGRFSRLFSEPAPYIAGWHQAPGGPAEGREELALHLELFTIRRADDKLKYLAGSESGMDAFGSDVLPEAAAARLREVGP